MRDSGASAKTDISIGSQSEKWNTVQLGFFFFQVSVFACKAFEWWNLQPSNFENNHTY